MKRHRLLALGLAILFILPAHAAQEEPQPEPVAPPAVTCFVDAEEYVVLAQQIALLQERQVNAHAMASAARALGFPEDSETILIAKQIWYNAEEALFELEPQLVGLSAPLSELPYEVFTKSNLTPEALELILEGTGLAGMGQAFYDMEQTYTVNALFAMAVAKTESGLGVTNYAKNRNNYFGMLGRTFESGEEGIMAFGELMNRNLYYGKTMIEIAEKYCPPTKDLWVEKNMQYMLGFWEKLSAATN